MRKETANIAHAFKARRRCTQARTMTDGEAVYLHGIKIAEWREGGRVLAFSLRGYVTNTTCDRVNGILAVCAPAAGRVFRKNWELHFGTHADHRRIDDSAWIEVPAQV